MANDSLASGASRASFMPPKVSAEKWARIWADDNEEKDENKTPQPSNKRAMEALNLTKKF